jgi:hypothetical protein
MIRREHCRRLEPDRTEDVRFPNRLFRLAA